MANYGERFCRLLLAVEGMTAARAAIVGMHFERVQQRHEREEHEQWLSAVDSLIDRDSYLESEESK